MSIDEVFWLTVFSFIGGIIYRIRGGLPPSLPRPIDQALYSIPFGYIAYLMSGDYYVCGLVFILTVVTVVKGHGAHMDLGTWQKERDNEWYEWSISWFRGKISEYWYDAIGLAISGFTYALPLIVCSLWYGLYTESLMLVLAGISKSAAYMLGWGLPSNTKHFRKGTELGEFFTGFFQWGVLGLVYAFCPL